MFVNALRLLALRNIRRAHECPAARIGCSNAARGDPMKKFVALLLAVLALATAAAAVEVDAPSALLMEKETGTVLYAKDEHAKLEPASVTKVMTILLTMEAIDSGTLTYDTVVTASAPWEAVRSG